MPEQVYKPEFAEQVYKLCLLNAVDREIADFFKVSTRTILGWRKKHPDFDEALRAGKMMADSEVAYRMFNRATGVTVTKQRVLNDGSIIDYKEELPPDTKAGEFWLNCRTKGMANAWTPKNETELSGDADNPLAFVLGEIAEESEGSSRLPSAQNSKD